MNVTNATVLFRSDSAANFTSANTTLGNVTYNAPEIAFEKDTKRFKIGIGNWTTVPYVPNATELSNITTNVTSLTATVANKTDVGHTHVIANTTGLQTALDGKANTTHTHAASDITSGTIATARLGSGTANSTTYLRGDGTWAVPAGNGTSNGTDRGNIFDVRDYGALTGFANETATTQAFQDCMDAIRTAGGGSMYIPATGVGEHYYLRRPIWCGFDNLVVFGEGVDSRTMCRGPAFMTTKHPKYWDCAVTSYTDVDTSSTVTVKTGGVVTNRERYRMDLTEFMSGGTYPPGGGRPALGVSTGPGYFGLRTRRNVMGGRYPFASLATGDNSASGSYYTQWSDHTKVEWNFIFYQHETTLVGAIAGAGSIQRPDPWILYGDGTDYVLDLALTDADGVSRTWIRCKFAQAASVGLHRITIQFDPNNATDADRIRAAVDRTRVTVNRLNVSDAAKEYHSMNTSNNSGNFTDLWDKWNRVANWQGADFTICNESAKVGDRNNLDVMSGWTDYTVLLVSAFKDFKHAMGSIGDTITKVGGAAADDSFVWPYTSGADSDATAIGWMANETYNDWSPASSEDDVMLKAFLRGRLPVWGYMHPKSTGDSIHTTSKNIEFRDFNIKARDNIPGSCGLLIGAVLNLSLENMSFSQGFYFSIGMLENRTCYPLRFNNLKPAKGIHLNCASVWARDWDFGYARNCMVLMRDSELHLDGFYGLEYDAFSTGYFRSYTGNLNSGLTLRNGNFNMEGINYAPAGPFIYYQKSYNHPNNRVVMEDVNFGEAAARAIYVDDTAPDSPARILVDIKRVGFGNGNTILTARGSKIYGEVEVDPHVYTNDVCEYLNTYGSATTAANYPAVKTFDRESFGLPPCGAFTANMHEVRVKRPAEGAPKLWTPTTTGIQCHSMPTWVASDFNGSAYQHAMSATFVPSLYVEATLPWPTAGTTTIEISGAAVGTARKLLATLLNGATAPDRATMSLRWGVGFVSHISTGLVDGQFFAADNLTNSSYWASAGATAAREKRTNANITATGGDAPPWNVRVRRRWSFGLHLGTDKTLAIAGRTNRIEPATWQGMGTSSYTLASGNLRVGLRSWSGGWVNTIANQILDWMMGGSFPSGITNTLYFALSTTPVSSSVTEPTTGSYARVSKVRNATTDFEETGDCGYIWTNKTAITFPSPTGDWGLIQGVAIYDASTSGNLIAAVPLNRPIRVYNGDQAPVFRPGALQISL